jgi:hypothetical protein
MNDLRFTASEVKLLAELVNKNAVSIIWDINAFYFNTDSVTYKLECCDATPAGSDYQYDELFFCRLSKLPKEVRFEEGKVDYWYKIVACNTKILEIEVVETIQLFPGDKQLKEDELPVGIGGLNRLCLGLLITTAAGVIPATLRPSNYGFAWLEKYEFYERREVEAILANDIRKYQLRKMSSTSD